MGAAAFVQATGQNPSNPTGTSGQAGGQTTPQGRQAGDTTRTAEQVTLVGCVQREADFRKAGSGGRGGTLGTGMGVGNEFVLINATVGAASSSDSASASPTSTPTSTTPTTATTPTTPTTSTPAPTTPTTSTPTTTPSNPSPTTTPSPTSPMPSPTGTTGSASAGTMSSPPSGSGSAYALTGNREKELEQHVGKRVEIVGTRESSGGTMGTSGTTGGTATGSPTGGTATGTTAAGTATGTATTSGSGSSSVGNLPEIRIVSFRSVAGSCPVQ